MAGKRGNSGMPLPVLVVGVMMLISALRNLRLDRWLGEDWPIFVGTFLLIIFMSMRELRKSRGPVPMPMPKVPSAEGTPGKLPFEIPELKGAPKAKKKKAQVYHEQPTPEEAEEEKERQQRLFRQAEEKKAREREIRAREEAEYEAQAKLVPTPSAQAARAVPISADALRNAVIYAEIFAPPKALRRRVKS